MQMSVDVGAKSAQVSLPVKGMGVGVTTFMASVGVVDAQMLPW
jgi:hypothetical protein